MVGSEDRRVSRVIDLVVRDLTRRPKLSEAAEVAGLESAYFSKLFRRSKGVTYAEWSARIRVDAAKDLLRIADLSITAVAVSVGYADVTTFERVFRRIEKCSPGEYRLSHRSEVHIDENRRI
jgi:transcriptional regulator GlxA family with amidase domain